MERDNESGATHVFDRLLDLAAADEALSMTLRELALHVLDRCPDVAQDADTQEDTGEATGVQIEVPVPKLVMNPGFAPDDNARGSLVYASEGPARSDDDPVDGDNSGPEAPGIVEELDAIVGQLQVKAEACRWALANPGQQGHAPESLHDRARGKDGHLWMLTCFYPSGSDDPAWQRAAMAFEAAAAGASLMGRLTGDAALAAELGADAHGVCADAALALESAVTGTGQGYDRSQVLLQGWLKRLADSGAFPVHVAPVAQILDAIDPRELADRTRELEARIDEVTDARRQRKSLLSKARYHAKKAGGGYAHNPAQDVRQAAAALDELVTGHGMRPSSIAIREMLALLSATSVDDYDDLPGYALCQRAHEAYAARRRGTTSAEAGAGEAEEVAAVRQLLRGKKVALIGGDPRPEAKRRIEEAFELDELVWMESRVHQSIESFKAVVIRPDIALVLLGIRWASHSYGELKKHCDPSGKPFVRLPKGYGVNQVASQIMAQADNRLHELTDQEGQAAIAV